MYVYLSCPPKGQQKWHWVSIFGLVQTKLGYSHSQMSWSSASQRTRQQCGGPAATEGLTSACIAESEWKSPQRTLKVQPYYAILLNFDYCELVTESIKEKPFRGWERSHTARIPQEKWHMTHRDCSVFARLDFGKGAGRLPLPTPSHLSANAPCRRRHVGVT